MRFAMLDKLLYLVITIHNAMKLKYTLYILVLFCFQTYGQSTSIFDLRPKIVFKFSSDVNKLSYSESFMLSSTPAFKTTSREIKLKLPKLTDPNNTYLDLDGQTHQGMRGWGDFMQTYVPSFLFPDYFMYQSMKKPYMR